MCTIQHSADMCDFCTNTVTITLTNVFKETVLTLSGKSQGLHVSLQGELGSAARNALSSLERMKYSFDSQGKHEEDNGSQNKIIHGDNLLVLKSLLPEYEGKVKCIYIDPPYNTGNENWIYNDNVNDPKIKKWLGEETVLQ